MMTREMVMRKAGEELMRLLRMVVEEPFFGNTYKNQAFGVIQFLVMLMPDREAELTAIWELWQKSYEHWYELMKKPLTDEG